MLNVPFTGYVKNIVCKGKGISGPPMTQQVIEAHTQVEKQAINKFYHLNIVCQKAIRLEFATATTSCQQHCLQDSFKYLTAICVWQNHNVKTRIPFSRRKSKPDV